MGCAEREEDLTLYHDGELPGERRRELEAHLRGCDACRAELAGLQRLDGLVRRAPSLPTARAESSAPFRGLETALTRARSRMAFQARLRVMAAAAACLVALALGYLLAPRGSSAPDTLAERITGLLAEYASTASEARRGAIAEEIEAEGDDALPYVVHALDSPSLALQVAATRLLGRTRDRKAASLLADYAETRGMLAPAPPAADDILAEPISVEGAIALLDAEGVPQEIVLGALRSAYERHRMEPRDVEVLRQVGFAHLPAVAPEAETIHKELRLRLRSGELKKQRSAIEAARAIRARPLVPDLIDCLGNEGARESAWTALREITGQKLPLDAGAWERWYRENPRQQPAPATEDR